MILRKHPNTKDGPAIGYWYSKYQPDLPHPQDFVQEDWDHNVRDMVIRYLESGKVLYQWRGYSGCRFCQESNGTKCLTDGTYVWPEGFAHYLLEHGVKPPRGFIYHIIEELNGQESEGPAR